LEVRRTFIKLDRQSEVCQQTITRRKTSKSDGVGPPLTKNEETRLNPIPLPVVPPPDRRGEIKALKRMLDDDPRPVVGEPPVLQGFDERHA
jgi:hypothetical protein